MGTWLRHIKRRAAIILIHVRNYWLIHLQYSALKSNPIIIWFNIRFELKTKQKKKEKSNFDLKLIESS